MNRFLNIAFLIMLFVAITGMFHIKNQVKNLKKDLVEINRQIIESKHAIHVLDAEWTYLTNPERIKKLANKYLDLKPMKVAQFSDPDNIESVYIAKNSDNNQNGDKYVMPNLKPILSNY